MLLYTYISRFSVNPHYQQMRKIRRSYRHYSVPNRSSLRFSTSLTNGPRLFTFPEAGTHSPSPTESHAASHTAKHGAFRIGAPSLPSDHSAHFGTPAWPGVRTANFAAFGSWPGVLPKNAESLRNSDALMRVAAPLGCADLSLLCQGL